MDSRQRAKLLTSITFAQSPLVPSNGCLYICLCGDLGDVESHRIKVDRRIVVILIGHDNRITSVGQSRVVGIAKDRVHVVDLTESLKERDQIQQLRIGHIVEPRGYRDLN
jgi:hypothetical protein